MINEIDLNGRAVLYELTRKKVKNINLRVRRDGSVAVSAGKRVSLDEIEGFMRSKADAILRALENVEMASRADSLTVTSGDGVSVLGERLTVIVAEGDGCGALRSGDELIVSVTDKGDRSLVERALRAYLDALCAETVKGIFDRVYPLFEARGIPRPAIRFRRMKTRWGSCNPKALTLNFNLDLIIAPIECIEYVVFHELVHLIHCDHSKSFHACLESYLPDAKQRRRLLNESAKRQIEQKNHDFLLKNSKY